MTKMGCVLCVSTSWLSGHPLDRVRWREVAGIACITGFKLECCVLNAELIVQFPAGSAEQRIIARSILHHKMGGEGGPCGTHAPDTQIVNPVYPGRLARYA